MNLRHLSTFLEVSRQRSFASAARERNYAQSTITLHIQELEADLGCPLIERGGHSFQLTSAGRILVTAGRELIERVEEIKREIGEVASGEGGEVTVASIEPLASETVPRLFAEFLGERPNVQLNLEIGSTGAVVRMVTDGAADFGVCSTPPASARVRFEPLTELRMGLLVRNDHPLADRLSITMRDIGSERLLMTEETCSYRHALERTLGATDGRPAATTQIASLRGLANAVLNGLGVAFVPEIGFLPERTRLKRLVGTNMTVPIGLVSRDDSRPPLRAASDLMDLVRAQLRDLGADAPEKALRREASSG